MAFIPGGKHFGQYTYEHWFDHEYGDEKPEIVKCAVSKNIKNCGECTEFPCELIEKHSSKNEE